MPKSWIYKKFNRRIFLALTFFLLASRRGFANKKLNTIRCQWCWLGAVTDKSITVKAKLSDRVIAGKNYIQIVYYSKLDRIVKKIAATSLSDRIATFDLVDLTENTVYHYFIVADGRRYPREGSLKFKTVKINQPYSFAIATSSCAGGTISKYTSYGVSNSKVFDTISQYKYKAENGQDSHVDLFVHLGDLHYRNDFPFLGSKENNLDDYRHNYDLVMSQARQKNLYQNIPLGYIWDDHDYGYNDSDGSYSLRYLASKAYREQVPHYPLPETLNEIKGEGAIYQSFVIGRVRFIMTDSRFYQRSKTSENDRDRTLLGNNQKQWLLQQLRIGKERQQSNKERLTIWINSIPWICPQSDRKTQAWNLFSQEREEIANFIKQNQIDKLLMISGDAHMLAIDDGKTGTANSYATEGGGSFPIIQAASLDSRGSYKGGPYNGEKYIVDSTVKSKNGAIPGQGQWGFLHFIDDSEKIEVKVELKRIENTLIKHNFVFD